MISKKAYNLLFNNKLYKSIVLYHKKKSLLILNT